MRVRKRGLTMMIDSGLAFIFCLMCLFTGFGICFYWLYLPKNKEWAIAKRDFYAMQKTVAWFKRCLDRASKE